MAFASLCTAVTVSHHRHLIGENTRQRRRSCNRLAWPLLENDTAVQIVASSSCVHHLDGAASEAEWPKVMGQMEPHGPTQFIRSSTLEITKSAALERPIGNDVVGGEDDGG